MTAPARAGWWPWRRRPPTAEEEAAAELGWTWRAACLGAGVGRTISTVTGPTEIAPKAGAVGVMDGGRYLIVELLPGQIPADLEEAAHRLAPALGAATLRVVPRGHRHARVELLDRDPLAELVPWRFPQPEPGGAVFLGRDEAGRDLRTTWAAMGHVVIQGRTGSGKSGLLYGALAGVAACRDVEVCGTDPTGLLLRPFVGTRHAAHQVIGLADHDAIEDLFRRLVEDMDQRLAALPAGRDVVVCDEQTPLRIVVAEEWAGVLKALDTLDPKRGKRVRAHMSRLLAEGRKAGIRVTLCVQRAEAGIVGSFERGQCSTRLSFAVDTADAIELLHPGHRDWAFEHVNAPPGVALLSVPGRRLLRIRAPWIGDYRKFSAAVSACR